MDKQREKLIREAQLRARAMHANENHKLKEFMKSTTDSKYIESMIVNVEHKDSDLIYSDLGNNGLRNLGNTCYMNTILQCIRHTKMLNSQLFRPAVFKAIRRNLSMSRVPNQQLAMLLNYMKVLITIWENNNGVLSPVCFKALISKLYSQFRGHDQHDAHECLTVILNSFHESLARDVVYKMSGNVVHELDKQVKNAHEHWAEHYKNKHSVVLDIFSGQMQTKTQCIVCNHISDKYDPFMAIDLPLPKDISAISPVSYTLYDCLSNYVEPQQFSKDNLYKCEKCNKRSQAYQIHSVWTLPNVLIIKFNCFKYQVVHGQYMQTKISDFIHYPIDSLDLSKYVSSPLNESTTYDLYAVGCHVGRDMLSGHYYAYTKHPVSGEWYKYDDNYAQKVRNLQNIVTNDAYILFYQRRSVK